MKKIKLIYTLVVMISMGAYSQTSIDGLVGYWPLNGNAQDANGSNNGVVHGNTYPTQGKDGAANTAMYFDGAGDYIQINAPQSSQITIAFWIKPDGATYDMRLLSSLDGTSNNLFGVRYANETIEVWSSWKPVVTGYDTTAQNKWSFVCMTIDANKNITGYLDGVASPTQSFTFIWPTQIGIGRKYSGPTGSYGYDFKGSIDEFMIFDRVLSPAEIQLLYGSPATTSFCDTLYCSDGKVGIGTTTPDMKLTVKGKVHAEEVKIDLSVPAPDYVFKKEYNLRTIEEVEAFIKENSHLPEIPSAKEFAAHGVMQAEMDMHLLKKVEELTLYTIAQEKKIKKLEALNEKLLELQARLEQLESQK